MGELVFSAFLWFLVGSVLAVFLYEFVITVWFFLRGRA
jgi:hypothetical protein